MIESIGIIGAGMMGTGIAHVCAVHGLDVRLLDENEAAIEASLQAIGRNMDRQIRKGTLSPEEKGPALARIRTTTSLEDLSDCDLIIEVVPEYEELKRKVYKSLTRTLKADAIIATNTSSLPITRLAAATGRPEQFVGMHFMNPVPVMQLVEIIRGIATSEETFRRVRELAVRLGKTPAVSEDFPAFIVNRILMPMVNEAVYTLYEGVGSVEGIDTAMRLGANHPMGPLELADFIGLDACLSIMNMLYEGLADSKYRPCPLLVKYVEAGWLGRKTGRGFYDYAGETPVPTR
ncbi:MAG: 3-hydroxybutyryl-CoA dehydrogenase [Alphaproteobacteria bacterium]|jgi:3-hydroxybutyryl-CoA dehydrogenase|nr:3-hydroxybutyryl-CoA dehydrogenase [Alphaproteobacteria bacterium]